MSNWQASDIRGKRVIGGVGWPQKGQTLVLDHESYPGMVEKAKAIKIATAKRGQGRKLEGDSFQELCDQEGLPIPLKEHRFEVNRRWRFDYAWLGVVGGKVALEVEGGVWSQGRHTRGAGFLGDIEKYNRAVVLGWRVVRCTPDKLMTMETVDMLKALLSEADNAR